MWVPTANTVPATVYMDFANGRYWYNGQSWVTQEDASGILAALGGTFTRASTAYYTNSAGLLASAASGVLRFDYNPVTLAAKGILLEGARTNLCPASQTLDNGAEWTYSNTSVTADAATAPDGTVTADAVAGNASATTHFLFPGDLGGALTSGSTYTLTAYAKKNTVNYLALNIQASANNYITAVFDLDAGVVGETSVGSGSGTIVATSIETLANGWYRIRLTGSMTGASTPVLALVPAASGNVFTSVGLVSFASSDASSIFAWGVQVELAAFPSSYIPTTTGSVTRAADVLSLGPGWYTGLAATILHAGQFLTASNPSASQQFLWRLNGTNAVSIDRFDTSANLAFRGASIAADTSISAGTSLFKLASAFQVGDVAVVKDAGSPYTSAALSAMPSSLISYQIGHSASGNQLFGNIQSTALWNIRVSNAELQRLTT